MDITDTTEITDITDSTDITDTTDIAAILDTMEKHTFESELVHRQPSVCDSETIGETIELTKYETIEHTKS
jgi:hypothetical protein